MAPHSSTLAWKIPWAEEPGRLQSLGSREVRTQLSDFTFPFHFHALEKEMETRSSVLAWRIPGTGEPGGLPSVGSHRVGQDWSDFATAAAAAWFCKSNSTGTQPCLFMYILPLAAVVPQWERPYGPRSLNVFYMALYRKSLPTTGLRDGKSTWWKDPKPLVNMWNRTLHSPASPTCIELWWK